jgi:hypothetical protein
MSDAVDRLLETELNTGSRKLRHLGRSSTVAHAALSRRSAISNRLPAELFRVGVQSTMQNNVVTPPAFVQYYVLDERSMGSALPRRTSSAMNSSARLRHRANTVSRPGNL